MDVQGASRWLNGPLDTAENASMVLEDLGKSWLAFAALTFGLGAVLSFSSGWHWIGFIPDAAYCALAGYLLPRRKSRFFVIVLLGFSLLTGLITLAARLGWMKQTGTNIILAGILIVVAVRGVLATFAYHGLVGSTPMWRNIILGLVVSGFMTVAGVVAVIVGAMVFEEAVGAPARDETLGVWLNAVVGLPLIAYYFLFRNRLPWVRPPERPA